MLVSRSNKKIGSIFKLSDCASTNKFFPLLLPRRWRSSIAALGLLPHSIKDLP